jgi:1-deoxy-D-xylulose-5-phosphate synthase
MNRHWNFITFWILRFVKPLDAELLKTITAQHDVLVTIEENAVQGGAGSAVNEWMMTQRVLIPVLNIGLPDRFIEQGTQEEIYHVLRLNSAGIEQRIREFMA